MLPWNRICTDDEMADNSKKLCQEDVEDEGQAVVNGVQVGAEPVKNPSERCYVKKSDLKSEGMLELLKKKVYVLEPMLQNYNQTKLYSHEDSFRFLHSFYSVSYDKNLTNMKKCH